ncbi:MAG: toxin-antitoxin system HicB family antitoxin [Candidatus Binatus sp.]|uniref:toxin-antitoxin system HicB family antitoxin n=1 Tax=Candidatus Binatus sp. TaxID=2811406 RepID=UPI003C70D261
MAKQRERERFDGYAVELFLDEDNDWLAHLVELPGISAFGRTPEKALEELDVAWAAAKESYAARGLEIPVASARRRYHGVFQVRIDKRVHRALAIEAERAGVSLNALVAEKLAKSV